MKVNKRLRAARVLCGYTQRQLAELVGLKEIDISRIETERSAPDDMTKLLISEALEKPTYELFES